MSTVAHCDIAIIGAGWAGLSAAVTLAQAQSNHASQKKIIVFERAPFIGGRARAIKFGEHVVDNGQHLMIGAYKTLLDYLNLFGLQESKLFTRTPLCWQMFQQQKPLFSLPFYPNASRLKQCLQTIFSTTTSLRNKVQLIKTFTELQRYAHQHKGCTVSEFLAQTKHPFLNQVFFEPLCLAALSTPSKIADLNTFATVLDKSFNLSLNQSDMLFNKVSLSDIFPNPAAAYLQQKQIAIHTNHAIQTMTFAEDGQSKCLHTSKGLFKAKHIILATTSRVASQLLESLGISNNASQLAIKKIAEITTTPITTVYCEYDNALSFPYPLLGSLNTQSQWFFDRAHCQQPHIASAVLTGPGPYDAWSNAQLIETVNQELQDCLHIQYPLVRAKVIREPEAAFLCHPNAQTLRPQEKTAFPGIWLAGDYCQTLLPACLEGALLSGQRAAYQLLETD